MSAIPFHVLAVLRKHFYGRNGSMRDLNTFVPAGSDPMFSNAAVINARGEIAGAGVHRPRPPDLWNPLYGRGNLVVDSN